MGVLILGAGYCGQRFAGGLYRLGIPVTCTNRTDRPAGSIGTWHRFDPDQGVLLGDVDLGSISHVLVSIPPDRQGQDPCLPHLRGCLGQSGLRWLGYLSSTGVYGDRDGGWVTEADIPEPSQPRSRARLAAEQGWQSSGLPVQLIRLPGIYGPGRSALDQLARGRARCIRKQAQVFSRVHVDDIVGALLHLIRLPEPERPAVVNVADDLPCPAAEVIEEAARLINQSPPPSESFEAAQETMSGMALSFWQDNRRVSNRVLREKLGYQLLHPTYREGLRDCLPQRR